jgi:predicted AAA+ superfamily ATPase
LHGSSDPMLFISGPRQAGKTFVAQNLKNISYFNWDTIETRKAYAKDPYFFRNENQLIVFDEIHKRKDWKKLLKGYFDSPSRKENFIVTGSGRMDLFQKGSDSLQGRYLTAHLFNLHLDETRNAKTLQSPRNFKTWAPDSKNVFALDPLLIHGGFPEPFLKANSRFTNRWQDEYINRLVREDVRDVSKIEKLDQLDLLVRLLPERVGSPISHKSISEDIEVSPIIIKHWLRTLEWLYFGIQLKPYHRKIHRAVKKEPKWYFFHWPYNPNPGTRFENFLAIQLYITCQAWRDQGFGSWELHYLRDQDHREVDFLITCNLKPIALIEAKHSSPEWTPSLNYYTQKLGIPGFLVTANGPTKRQPRGWSLNASKFLSGLLLD